ncbi:nuclease [Methylococcaceae bacterium HT3]|nr:nuclease [Methylococcaceae bacterium HT3]
MSTKQIHVFISHSWAYSDHYDRLSEWIFKENWRRGQASLDFRDFSVPENDPIHNANNDLQLKNAIYDKISRSHVVIIPTGMYTHRSKWIKKEIEGAKEFRKPILAVNPHGQERKAGVVLDKADELVGWNKQPLIDAIWKLYNQ